MAEASQVYRVFGVLMSSLLKYYTSEEKVDEAFDRIGEYWGKNRVKSDSGAEPISLQSPLNQVS